jgi:large subunit ribosomal protein L24
VKQRIKRGDTVEVISGVDAGKRGTVMDVDSEKSRALVEGINMIKRHERPNPNNQQGGIVEKEAAVHLSKIMPIDPQTGERTRVRRKVLDDGSKVRIAVKSGEQLPDSE